MNAHASENMVSGKAPSTTRGRGRRGFSLLELLVCIAIIAVLVALLARGLAGTRAAARQTICLTNQKQLITAWCMYANIYQDRAMPLAEFATVVVGPGGPSGPVGPVYWWGGIDSGTGVVDYDRGLLTPFLDSSLNHRSVFECPAQPWGSYRAQGTLQAPTSTYGYNGYYLTPSRTPGWSDTISFRPWRRLGDIRSPEKLFVFADTMLPTTPARNCALLDPPYLFEPGEGWVLNSFPTTAFRHGMSPERTRQGACVTARGDGSVQSVRGRPEWIIPNTCVGSATGLNEPHYIPDASDWH